MIWTPAERYAIRQMLDVGCVSMRPGPDTLAKYRKLRDLKFVDAETMSNGRVKIAITDRGRTVLSAQDTLERAA